MTVTVRHPHHQIVVTDAPYNARGDGVTDDTDAIQSAIDAAGTAGGGNVLLPRTIAFSGVVDVPTGVNIVGGGGKNAGDGTRIVCLDAAAQLQFGDQVVGEYGGESGHFHLDGNSVATNPLYVGVMAGRAFAPLYVTNGAAGGAAVTLAGTQNGTFVNLRIESTAGDGLVLDRGAGGNTFLGLGIADCDGWAVKFVRTGASPLVYAVPTDNHIVGYMIENYGATTSGLIYHGAGVMNKFSGGTLSLPAVTSAKSLVQMAVDDVSYYSADLIFDNATWFGVAAYVTAMTMASGNVAAFGGRHTVTQCLRTFYAANGSQVYDNAQWNLASSGWFVSPTGTAGAEGTIVAQRMRSKLAIVRRAAADVALLASNDATANYGYIAGDGAIWWNNDTALYRFGAGVLAATGTLLLTPKASPPATCTQGELYVGTDGKLRVCSAGSTWTVVGSQS